MRKITGWFYGLALFGAANTPMMAQHRPTVRPPAPLRPHLADYDSELRRPDGRVDMDAMVTRLKELGVTSYYWLIWHAPTDWDDLKLFLPKAREAGIESQSAKVLPADRCRLHFRERDDFTGPTAGYHFKQLLVDETIAEQLRLSLQAWQDGKCDGVVTYCLDKRPASQTFDLAQKLFREFKTARPGPPRP